MYVKLLELVLYLLLIQRVLVGYKRMYKPLSFKGKTEASTSDTDISPYGSEATRCGIDPSHI